MDQYKPKPEVAVLAELPVGYNKEDKGVKEMFLAMLEETGQVAEAANLCNITPASAYRWRQRDPEFADAWDFVTRCKVVPKLEEHAIKRAINGSDLLLIFLLKSYRRDLYDDRMVALLHGQGPKKKKTRIIIEDANGKVIADVSEEEDGETIVERREVDSPGSSGN
jgi:hypothetical protein